MHCLKPLKIKSNNPYNIKETYIPCGHCAECRKIQKTEWTTRLQAEIEYYHTQKHYRVGFLTLTYDERHLPTIPKKFFKEGEYRRIPCFSYEDIKKFINTLRCYFWREKELNNAFRYFLTCEYGEKHHRPHYHAILLYHPSISDREMYDVCQDAWCGTQVVIAQNTKNKKLQRMMHGIIAPFESFVPRDTYACGAYVAKYVCKDLEFQETAGEAFDHLDRKSKNHLRHFIPFHRQSLGFGSCILKDKTDDELAQMYKDGMDLTCSARKVAMPRYIKDRLLYRIQKHYNVRTHKNVYVKKYSKWFMEYRDLVYDVKLTKTRNYFLNLGTKEYWSTKETDDTKRAYETCRDLVGYVNQTVGMYDLARFYILYYGVPYKHCHDCEYSSDLYLARYDPCADLSDLPLLDKGYYDFMSNLISMFKGFEHLQHREARSDHDALIEQVRAFYNNMRR